MIYPGQHWSKRKSKGVVVGGPYAAKTIFGCTINSPLRGNETTRPCANFIRSDDSLTEQFQAFSIMEFNDSVHDKRMEMLAEVSCTFDMMEVSV